jgi:hypothetical protein
MVAAAADGQAKFRFRINARLLALRGHASSFGPHWQFPSCLENAAKFSTSSSRPQAYAAGGVPSVRRAGGRPTVLLVAS